MANPWRTKSQGKTGLLSERFAYVPVGHSSVLGSTARRSAHESRLGTNARRRSDTRGAVCLRRHGTKGSHQAPPFPLHAPCCRLHSRFSSSVLFAWIPSERASTALSRSGGQW